MQSVFLLYSSKVVLVFVDCYQSVTKTKRIKMMAKMMILALALIATTNAALLPAAAPVAYTGLPAYSGLPSYPYTFPVPAAYSALPYRTVAPVAPPVYPAAPFRAALPVPAAAGVAPVFRTALPAALPPAPLVKAAPFTAPVAAPAFAAPVPAPAFPAPAFAAPVAAPLAVAPVAAAKVDYADAYPQYQYAYNIQDAITGDSKAQEEIREGGVVKGRYSLIDADGSRRTVNYYADPLNGFNAVVQKDLPVVAAPVAPLVKAAPAIVSV